MSQLPGENSSGTSISEINRYSGFSCASRQAEGLFIRASARHKAILPFRTSAFPSRSINLKLPSTIKGPLGVARDGYCIFFCFHIIVFLMLYVSNKTFAYGNSLSIHFFCMDFLIFVRTYK